MRPRRYALRSVLRPVRRHLIASSVAASLSAVSGVSALVAVAGVLRELVSRAPDQRRIWWLIVAALIGVLARFWLRAASIRVSHLASYDLETLLRRQLTEHLGHLPLGDVATLGSGAVKKVVQDDVRALHAAAGDVAPSLGYAVAGPIAAVAVMLIVDWRLALASLALAPAAWLSLRLGLRDQEHLRRAWNDANEAMNSAAIELVQGMAVVRTFDAGVASSRRFRQRVDEFTAILATRRYTSKRSITLARLFIEPLPTMLVIVTAGLWLVGRGSLSVADLALFLLIGTMPVESVTPVAWLAQFLRDSSAAAARIGELLAVPGMVEPEVATVPPDGSVRLCGVRFSYRGERGSPVLMTSTWTFPMGACAPWWGPRGLASRRWSGWWAASGMSTKARWRSAASTFGPLARPSCYEPSPWYFRTRF